MSKSTSSSNIFWASLFLNFGQSEIINQFHEQTSWNEKYRVALSLKDPRASFIAKRLIFDESPETLSDNDFRFVHRELHDRLVINQERPFTTIPEAMMQTDTELSNLEDSEDENKDKKLKILNDYNTYLSFLENYFSTKNPQPLKTGKELVKQIFG